MFDSIGRPLVVWPCYEPAGEQVALTENELVRHVLLLGSTGCGKSTLLAAAMGQILVRCEEKVGLLVLDAKADGLADQVRDAAWQAGRSKDVMIFGPGGDHTLDLFEPLGSLQGVEAITRRIMLAADPMSGDNAYWQTTTTSMYSAAFSLYAAAGKPVHFSAVMEFLRRWFMPANIISTIAPGVPKLRRYIQQFTTVLLTEEQLSSAVANLLRIKRNGLALDDHLRSLRHPATGQSLPPWENGAKHTFDVGAMSASAKMTQSNRKAKDTSKGAA